MKRSNDSSTVRSRTHTSCAANTRGRPTVVAPRIIVVPAARGATRLATGHYNLLRAPHAGSSYTQHTRSASSCDSPIMITTGRTRGRTQGWSAPAAAATASARASSRLHLIRRPRQATVAVPRGRVRSSWCSSSASSPVQSSVLRLLSRSPPPQQSIRILSNWNLYPVVYRTRYHI